MQRNTPSFTRRLYKRLKDLRKIKLTRHAKNRNRRIKVTVQEIVDAIERPDEHYLQEDDRYVAIKATGNKLLKIVYVVEGKDIVVLTIIDLSK